MEVYNWIVANWEDIRVIGAAILTIWSAIVTISSLIVKWVPELKKGTLGKAIIKAIAIYGALNR
jgi:hypothetical protein